MKSALCALCFILPFASGSAIAQTNPAMPLIKGHRIGESLVEYLGGADRAKAAFEDCGRMLSDPANQKRYSKGPNDRKPFEVQFRNLVEGCLRQGDAVSGKDAVFTEGLQSFIFSDSRLIEIKIWSVDAFDDVVRDLSQKFGPPDAREDIKYQNAFGAVFFHPMASWVSRKDVRVVAVELPDAVVGLVPKIYPVDISIEERAHADKLALEKAKRPNSLD